MNLVLVAIKDKKGEDFGPAYTSKNTAIAIRDFSDACQQNQTWKKYPEDFALYLIGKYETKTGKIEDVEKTLLAEASTFVIKEEKCPEDTK